VAVLQGQIDGLLLGRQIARDVGKRGRMGRHPLDQGAGFLLGLKTSRPAKDVQAALMAKNILTGTSGDPHILRLLPAYIMNEGHVDQLCDALSTISA